VSEQPPQTPAQEDTEEKKPIVRMMPVKLLKPLNTDWQTAGEILRNLSRSCARMANITLSNCVSLDSDLFNCITFNEEEEAELPTNRRGKVKLPPLPPPPRSEYKQLAERYPFVSSGIVSAVTREARQKYIRDRFDMILGRKSSTTYRSFPIPIRGADWRLSLTRGGDSGQYANFIISIPLLSTKSNKYQDTDGKPLRRITFALETGRLPSDRIRVLRQIAEGDMKRCTLRLVWKQRRKSWIVNIPYYHEPKDHELDPERVMELYPPGPDDDGTKRFLKCVFKPSGGQVRGTDVEFKSIVQSYAVYRRRSNALADRYRQDRQSGTEQPQGRIGHGRRRAMRDIRAHEAKYNRSQDTWCKQRAAFIAKTAIRWKCGKIRMVDLSEIPPASSLHALQPCPNYRLTESIQHACEASGIVLELIKPEEHETVQRFLETEQASVVQATQPQQQ